MTVEALENGSDVLVERFPSGDVWAMDSSKAVLRRIEEHQ